MPNNNELTVRCMRCGHSWLVDVQKLGTPDSVVYRDPQRRTKDETYRLICPACGTVNMLEVTVEESGNAR